MSNLNKALADAILPMLQDDLDARVGAVKSDLMGRMEEIAAKVTGQTREIIIRSLERPDVNIGRQHERFESLLRCVMADTPVWLAGPAGSGKTAAPEKVAEALGLAFSSVSIGPQTTQAHLFGYMDATGVYRGTQVRARFEFGGVLLLDEIDRGNPGCMTSLNALLANSVCAFPDGMIVRHPDFRIIAAANTIGQGADRQYVGALQLDAATLDRFAVLDWGYDLAFESELAAALGGTQGTVWCARVQALRASAADLKLRHVISPRATLNGIRLLQVGTPVAEVESMTVWRGLDAASQSRILEHARVALPMPEATPVEAEDDETPHETERSEGLVCPKCGKSTSVIKSKFATDYSHVCWRKRGGCSHKFTVAS